MRIHPICNRFRLTQEIRCEEWGKPIAPPQRIKVYGDGDSCRIVLEDATSGQRFATCPVDLEHPEVSVEPATDSSRFFVLRIVEGDRHAFLGMGFKERTHAFDFNVAIQDYVKYVFRASVACVEVDAYLSFHRRLKRAKEPAPVDTFQAVDYSLKQGEKVHIQLNIKKKTTAPSAGGAGGLLPPPGFSAPAATSAAAPARTGAPSGGAGGQDLLKEFGF